MTSVAKLSLTVLEGRAAPGAALYLDFLAAAPWVPGPEWSGLTGPLTADARALASADAITALVRDRLWPLGIDVRQGRGDASPLSVTAEIGYSAHPYPGVSGLSFGPLGQGGALSPDPEAHTFVIYSALLPTAESVAGGVAHELGRELGLGNGPGFMTTTGAPVDVGGPNGYFTAWQAGVMESFIGDPGPASSLQVQLVYATWLHRAATDSDWALWQQTGLGPAAVERDVALSPESFAAAVRVGADWAGTLYQERLGRRPDPAGHAACYEVAGRAGWATVYSDVAGSAEAAAHAGRAAA